MITPKTALKTARENKGVAFIGLMAIFLILFAVSTHHTNQDQQVKIAATAETVESLQADVDTSAQATKTNAGAIAELTKNHENEIAATAKTVESLWAAVDANAQATKANADAIAQSAKEREDERYILQLSINRSNLQKIEAMGYDHATAWKLMNEVAKYPGIKTWENIIDKAPNYVGKRITQVEARLDSMLIDYQRTKIQYNSAIDKLSKPGKRSSTKR